MQITVDTEKDSAAVLSNVGKFLVLGYGTLADKTAIVEGAAPQPSVAVAVAAAPLTPVIPPAPDFAPSDSLPPSPIEEGKAPADVQAAAVFGGVAAAPTVPTLPVAAPAIPAAPGAVAVVERDTAGVPYDARIHNKSRTKKQDGTWKLAKGIDPATVTAVLAQIGAAPAVPLAPAPVPPVPPVPVPPAPSAPVAPAAVTPPAAPSTSPAGAITFRAVMQKVTENQTAGRLTKAQIDHALAQVGFKPDELAPLVMPANAALLAAFNSLIDAALGA